MELDGSNPVLAFGTQNSTEAQLIFCSDPFCNATQNTIVLEHAHKVRLAPLVQTPESGLANVQIATNRFAIAIYCYIHTMEAATPKK